MEETKQTGQNGKRKRLAIGVFLIVGIIGLVSTIIYIRYKATHITTDDAFIEARVHVIAPKVAGTVKSIAVTDNQFVHAGDLLVEVDAKDYEVQLQEAEASFRAEDARRAELSASVVVAKRQRVELESQLRAARANLTMQEATQAQAEKDMKRADALLAKEAISKERHERAFTGYEVAVASVKAARDRVAQAEAAIDTQNALIQRAEAAETAQAAQAERRRATMETAALQKGYTRIVAPADGYVTRKSAEAGNQVQAGQPIMAVVPLGDIWVIANYKETQLAKIKPGQEVEIEVDTFKGKTFKGKVDSIMAGTGAVFSLFPPENATGNFVKVVQRIPVKIVFEKGTDPDHLLRVGMSVVSTVLVK